MTFVTKWNEEKLEKLKKAVQDAPKMRGEELFTLLAEQFGETKDSVRNAINQRLGGISKARGDARRPYTRRELPQREGTVIKTMVSEKTLKAVTPIAMRTGVEDIWSLLIDLGLKNLTEPEIRIMELRNDYMTEPEFLSSFRPKFGQFLIDSGEIHPESNAGVKWYKRTDVADLVKKYGKVFK